MGKARSVVGIIGNVITAGLFCSPMPTMYKIQKTKSVQEFSPDPYIITVFNCLMWTLYGLPFIKKDNILVSTINGAGFVLELIYVCFFLFYSKNNSSSKRIKILVWLLIEAVAFAGIFLFTMFALHGEKKRSLFIGVLCVVFNVAMYMSPLTIMAKVIKTKSVEFMPFWLTFFNFLNGGIWLTYALLRFDLFMAIPSGLGMISGIFQLLLYAWFFYSKPSAQEDQEEEEEEGTKTPPTKEIQIDSMV